VRCLPDKKAKLPQGLPLSLLRGSRPKSVRASSKIIYSEFPKFHPNPFTSGEVIAERVNIVETRHEVFPILGEASSVLFSVYIDDIGQLQNNLTGSFVVLYADDILLLAPSVTALQKLLRVCEHEVDSIDMSIIV